MTKRRLLFSMHPKKLASVGNVTEELDFRSRLGSQSSVQGASTETLAKSKKLRKRPWLNST